MTFRLRRLDWTNEYPRAVLAVTAGSFLMLLVVAVPWMLPDRPPPMRTMEKEWYYDLNTGKLFVADTGLTPPIDAPSGPFVTGAPAGVRACVLAHSSDPNESERFIAFLETTASGGLRPSQSAPAPRQNTATEWARGKLIRRPSDKHWVPADSQQGQVILSEAFVPNEDGRYPTYYQPE